MHIKNEIAFSKCVITNCKRVTRPGNKYCCLQCTFIKNAFHAKYCNDRQVIVAKLFETREKEKVF